MTDERRRLLLSGARWLSRNPRPPTPDEFRRGDPWLAFGYLVSGVLLYGLIGWLLDRWLGTTFLVVVGILVGMHGLGMLHDLVRASGRRGRHDPAPGHPRQPDTTYDAVRTTQETR